MKNIILTIIGSLLLPYQAYSQSTDPAIPVGTLNVNMGMVRQGVAPTLGWSIEYPNEIDDIITKQTASFKKDNETKVPNFYERLS